MYLAKATTVVVTKTAFMKVRYASRTLGKQYIYLLVCVVLCEREPTVSIPMATSRVQIVNCKYEKPIVGSPEELVEAESYTEPDKWEEPFDQDTVVVEAYPTVEFHHGKDTSGSSRLVTGEYLQRNKNTSQVTVEAIGKKGNLCMYKVL